MELIVEVVHPQVKLKATCKALTMGARLDFDAILQQTYFALCLWEFRGSSTSIGGADLCSIVRSKIKDPNVLVWYQIYSHRHNAK